MAKFISTIAFLVTVLLSFKGVAYYEETCLIETKFYERKYDIQPSLLTAISVVETGRWNADKGENTPWPWTINAEGKGMFFASKKEAIEAVRNLQRQGVESIDVGCMQINLKYHPDAFKDLEEAFEPSKNVDYGARFLKSLYERHSSWFVAARHYHSALDEKNVSYGSKILTAFQNLSGNTKNLKAEVKKKHIDAKNYAHNYRAKMLEKYRKSREQNLSNLVKNDSAV